jgi:hypothetical protein
VQQLMYAILLPWGSIRRMGLKTPNWMTDPNTPKAWQKTSSKGLMLGT